MSDFSFRNTMREYVAENYCILNRNNIVKNNTEELIQFVIDIVKNIPTGTIGGKKKKKDEKKKKKKKNAPVAVAKDEPPKWHLTVDYISHYSKMVTQQEKSDSALVQYIKYRNVVFDYPLYVRTEDSHTIELNVTVMFNPYSYEIPYQEILKYNTKKQLLDMMDRGIEIDMNYNVKKILEFEGEPYIDPNNEEHSFSLLNELKIYIPVNPNGYYHINGRKLYNGYYLNDPNQMADGGKKIIIRHPSSLSFIYLGANGMINHQVFGDDINPFIYDEEDNWEELLPIFEGKITEEQVETVRLTHAKYLEDKAAGTLKIPLEKAMVEIYSADVYAGIITMFDVRNNPEAYKSNSGIYFRKYASLRGSQEPNVEHAIRDCVPSFKNNKPKSASKGWNVHPESMITSMVRKNQFIANGEPNPLDVFHLLSFTRVDSKNITESSRYVNRDELGIVDPIYTTGEDIGASGVLCASAEVDIRR